MNLHPFVRELAALRLNDCFNPYSDRCEIHDRSDAPASRAKALSEMLESAMEQPIDAIWIGRDLGYRGGRRTGLALTDDVHIECHVRRWGVVADRPTIGSVVAERTAAMIWSVLNQIDARIFLWNVSPLHPHESADQFTNRQHNAKERSIGEQLLRHLIDLVRPTRIIAIGNDAAAAASRMPGRTPMQRVRHPSYGGQKEFLQQVTRLYRVSSHRSKLL